MKNEIYANFRDENYILILILTIIVFDKMDIKINLKL